MVMPIAFRHHLRLPSRLWLLGKALAMMEGVGLQLAPGFDVFAVSQPYVRKFLWQTVSPQTWGRRLLKSGGDWGELLADLPRRVPRLVDQLEEGDLHSPCGSERSKPFSPGWTGWAIAWPSAVLGLWLLLSIWR